LTHYRLDVTLGEDHCGIRVPAVAQMLAVLNSVILSLMDFHQIASAGSPNSALVFSSWRGACLVALTFAKPWSVLRPCYLVVPPGLVETFACGLAVTNRQFALGDQLMLTEFMREGHFTRHIRRMKGIYLERQQALVAAAQQRLRSQPIKTLSENSVGYSAYHGETSSFYPTLLKSYERSI
jgi:hypothetical protein